MRLLKILVVLVAVAFAALTGYAYLGDMEPRPSEQRRPVMLDTGAAVPARTAPAAAPQAAAAQEDAPADTAPDEQADPDGLD
ncbi:MAG: hypothetical protein Q4G25_07600 [Paracoccus sp. (in: a-proteobacteria)]|nr:hypothetical protein [Paracoccus sp. (in: a-proteobacteria)]